MITEFVGRFNGIMTEMIDYMRQPDSELTQEEALRLFHQNMTRLTNVFREEDSTGFLVEEFTRMFNESLTESDLGHFLRNAAH
jgi:hypothetical protein